MDIGSLFFLLALLLLIGVFLSRPLIERRATIVISQDHDLSALLAERERILSALEELDFDHALGKIPEAEYPTQRATLLRQGAEILRRLDQLTTKAPIETFEERLEAAVAARRTVTHPISPTSTLTSSSDIAIGDGKKRTPELEIAPTSSVLSEDELEAMIAARRRQRMGKSAGFCPKCGKAIQMDDLFCPGCGRPLK